MEVLTQAQVLDSEAVKEAIKVAGKFTASKKSNHEIYKYVHVYTKDIYTLVVVATDAHKLFYKKIPVLAQVEKFNILVDSKTCAPIDLDASRYQDVTRFLPKENKVSYKIDIVKALKIFKSMKLLAETVQTRGEGYCINLDIKKESRGGILKIAHYKEKAQVKLDFLESSNTNFEIDINFNPTFVVDGLAALKKLGIKEAKISFTSENPLYPFTLEDGKGKNTILITPMRVN